MSKRKRIDEQSALARIRSELLVAADACARDSFDEVRTPLRKAHRLYFAMEELKAELTTTDSPSEPLHTR